MGKKPTRRTQETLFSALGGGEYSLIVFGLALFHFFYVFRECPGKVFADANVWLVSACIIAAFQAPVSRNEFGEKVVPPTLFTSGFVRCVRPSSLVTPHVIIILCTVLLIEKLIHRHPVPFACEIKPRSLLHSGLIRHAVNSIHH